MVHNQVVKLHESGYPLLVIIDIKLCVGVMHCYVYSLV